MLHLPLRHTESRHYQINSFIRRTVSYQTKYGNDNYGKSWAIRMWPMCGNDMGRLGDHMEFIWGHIFANFKLWKVYGKKSSCCPLYGRAIRTECPHKSLINY